MHEGGGDNSTVTLANAKGSPRTEVGKGGQKAERKETDKRLQHGQRSSTTLGCRGHPWGLLTLALKPVHLRQSFLGREARTQEASVSNSFQFLPTFSSPAAAAL